MLLGDDTIMPNNVGGHWDSRVGMTKKKLWDRAQRNVLIVPRGGLATDEERSSWEDGVNVRRGEG